MKKVLALFMSLLLTVGLSSAVFADQAIQPYSENGLVDALGQPIPAQLPVASGGQTTPPASSAPESSAPESSAPESSEPESSASEAEQSEASENDASSSQQEPESSENASSTEESSKEEQSSSSPSSNEESSAPESSNEESSSSNEESSREESSKEESSGTSSNNENAGSPKNNPADEIIDDIPYVPENTGDLFGVRSASTLKVPEVTTEVPPSAIIDDNTQSLNSTNTAGSAWLPVSGIPDVGGDGVTISASTKLVFAVPDNNFATSATTSDFNAKLKELNDNVAAKYKVEVKNGGVTPISNFDVQFVSVSAKGSGRAFGVQLTPKNIPSEGLLLLKNTSFGFENQANPYRYSKELLIASNSPGNTKATGIADGAQLGGTYTWITKNGKTFAGGIDQLDDAEAGDEYLIHFSPQFFEWSGNIPAKVTLTNIRGKISLRQTGTTSSRVFEAVELVTSKGEAVVRIKFRDNLLSTKPVDFKTKIYLTVSGKRHEDSSLEMEGTFGDIENEEFYSEDKEIDISDGMIGVAMESINRVKIYIGDGVTLKVPFIRKNAKFYGTVSTDPDKYDMDLMEQYPDIIEVLTLNTLGLNGAGVTVDIDTYNGYHIYDKDLNYLGQTTRNLEFSEKYYLASHMLDIETEPGDGDNDNDDIPIVDDDYYPPQHGGDDPSPSQNANKNPSTGRPV